MEFEEKDFNKLSFNVHKHKGYKGDILDHFPTAKEYLSEFVKRCPKELDFNAIFKFVVYLYDRQTPLLKIDEYVKRRKEACILAEFPTNKKGYLTQAYLDAVNGQSHFVNTLALWLCRLLGDLTHTEYVMYLDDYYRERSHYQNETDATKRSACLKNMEFAKNKVVDLKQELLARSQNIELEICLNEDIIDRELELSPEHIAEKIAANLDPLDGYNPYEN